ADETWSWLNDQNLSVEELEQRVRGRYARELVKERVAGDRVEAYFAEHRTDFDAADLSQITVGEKDVAEERAAQLREEAADCVGPAKKQATEEWNNTGGRIGRLGRGGLRTELPSAGFNARPGEVLGPFEEEGSYLLF